MALSDLSSLVRSVFSPSICEWKCVKHAVISVNETGDSIIVPAKERHKIVVMAIVLSASGDQRVVFKSGREPLSGGMSILAGQKLIVPSMFNSLLETEVGKPLVLSLLGDINVGGWLKYAYIEED